MTGGLGSYLADLAALCEMDAPTPTYSVRPAPDLGAVYGGADWLEAAGWPVDESEPFASQFEAVR